LLFSPAFTADCLETVIEIGDEYKELFIEAGGETLDYVPSLNFSDAWVQAIIDITNSKKEFKCLKNDILKGKKILVTGGGTGLGKEMSEHYVKHGADLVICGRRESVLADTAQ
jgi:hypothetical protein